MNRPTFSSGLYASSNDWDYGFTEVEIELQQRFLAVSDSYGIASGYSLSDTSTTGDARLSVSPGYAYDASANRVELVAIAQFSNLTSADVGKWIIATSSLVGDQSQAHPYTGESIVTRLSESFFTISLATAVVPATDVMVCKITDVQGGIVPTVTFDTSDENRDVLSFPQGLPFYVVGNDGDALATFTGNDATPFNDAITAAKTAASGGTIYVRPGSWTITDSNPLVAENFISLNLVGEGKASEIILRGTGEPGTCATFASGESLRVSNLKLVGETSSYFIPKINLEEVRVVSFNDNEITYGPVWGDRIPQINFVSGIERTLFRNNIVSANNFENFFVTFDETTLYDCGNVTFDNNTIYDCDIYYNGGVNFLTFSNNILYKTLLWTDVNNSLTPPRGLSINNNTVVSGGSLLVAVNGAIISNNVFEHMNFGAISLAVHKDFDALYTKIHNNMFDWSSSLNEAVVGISVHGSAQYGLLSGVSVVGNTFVGNGSGICISVNYTDYALIDTNLFANVTSGIVTGATSTNSYATVGIDNTTNRVV